MVIDAQIAAKPDQGGGVGGCGHGGRDGVRFSHTAADVLRGTKHRQDKAPDRGIPAKMHAVASVDLTNHFLIAMPNMADPHFSRSLTYICEHNDQGALGVVVNRPIDMTVLALLERLEIKTKRSSETAKAPVYFGGPVQTDRGFVLHSPLGEWKSRAFHQASLIAPIPCALALLFPFTLLG